MKKNNKINMEGKIAIKLEENGYAMKGNILAIVRDGVLSVYEIKKQLSHKELRLLGKDLKYGLKKIEEKLRKSGPIVVTSGDVYFSDIAIIKGEGKIAYIAIF